MTWTALRASDSGVLLYDEHCARMRTGGETAARLFRNFARDVTAGAWVVEVDGDSLSANRLPGTGLVDGARSRVLPSPFRHLTGSFPKPPRPSPYHALRTPGVVTLLSDADGHELYESCAAAIVGWDGSRLVFPPESRPRVWSTAERFFARAFDHVRAPLLQNDTIPLLAINAVAGTCAFNAGRAPFPADVRARLDRAFAQSAQRGN